MQYTEEYNHHKGCHYEGEKYIYKEEEGGGGGGQ